MSDAVLIDVGLTSSRVSLMQRSQGKRPRFAYNFEFDNDPFTGVGDVLEHYRALIGVAKLPPMLGVSFGGPVRGRTSFSNGRWVLSLDELKQRFGFEQTFVVNDNAALAAALPWLGHKDLARICPKDSQIAPVISDGRYAVIFANHGLCAAALTHTRNGYEVIDTEAGHTAFAPSTPLEVEILKILSKSFHRVSNERLVSDAGLVNIHRAICELHDLPHTAMRPIEILLYARTSADAACAKTLEVYFSALGAFAGDVALSLCSEGGVYFYCNALLQAGTDPMLARLRETFEAKGQFSEFVGAIPTLSITNLSAPLVGLSWVANDILENTEQRKISAPGMVQAFSGAMEAVDQTVIILDAACRVVSVTGTVWDDPTLREEMLAVGADFAESLKRMDALGLLGLAQTENIAALTDKLRRNEEFTVERRLFGGRISEMRARPLSGGGYAIIDRDVTELKQRTDDLENLAHDLRTASSAAESASRAKSQFLANMSHEIRTPLNGVLGMADILSRTSLSPEQADMLNTVIWSGNSLLTVINDVLDFSKIEAGKMRLSMSAFNLRNSIEETVAALAPTAEAKHLELIVRIDPALCETVIGDEGRVRQILTNILGNAIKFTDKGHILVNAKATENEHGVAVTLSVTDTGCGIPKDKLESVFEMFEQVDGSASRHHDGTGLGLAITRKLLDMMQGRIEVESEFGSHTTFRMFFNLSFDPAGENTLSADNADILGKSILIVDDNPVNRQILEEQTRSWGLVPTAVTGGAEALSLLSSKHNFAMAILDYQMPGMNGFELAQRLKENPDTAGLPLMLLSSVGQLSGLQDASRHLFETVLVKPARSGQLAAKVRQIIAQPRARTREETKAFPLSIANSARAEKVGEQLPPAPISDSKDAEKEDIARKSDKITVLVAEDNEVNRRVIAAMLANEGYDIHFAHDGVQAVSAYRDIKPNIVLMDVLMPNLDGMNATAQIRKMEIGSKRARIIGLTACAMAEDRQACLDSGMDDYLPKPINRENLMASLRA